MSPQLTSLLSILIPSAIASVGVLVSAWFLRRSARERNNNDLNVAKDVNDTTAFKVVTDQLFALNGELRDELEKVKKEVAELKGTVEARDDLIDGLERDLGVANTDLAEANKMLQFQIGVTRQLANYIKRLIAAWPTSNGPPPPPDQPIEWSKHL